MKKIIHPDQIVVCDCHSSEHHLQLHYFIDNDNPFPREVYIQPFLNTYYNFWKRVKAGIKYIFGYKCMYGQWDSMCITRENYQAFKDMIDFLDEKLDIIDTFAIRDEEIKKYNDSKK